MHVEGGGNPAILLFSYRNDTEMGISLQIDKI